MWLLSTLCDLNYLAVKNRNSSGKPLTRLPRTVIQTSTHPVEGRCNSHRKVGLSGSMGLFNMEQRRPFMNLNGELYVY